MPLIDTRKNSFLFFWWRNWPIPWGSQYLSSVTAAVWPAQGEGRALYSHIILQSFELKETIKGYLTQLLCFEQWHLQLNQGVQSNVQPELECLQGCFLAFEGQTELILWVGVFMWIRMWQDKDKDSADRKATHMLCFHNFFNCKLPPLQHCISIFLVVLLPSSWAAHIYL